MDLPTTLQTRRPQHHPHIMQEEIDIPTQDISGHQAITASWTASLFPPDDDLVVQRCADALKMLLTRFSLPAMKELVKLWQARGTNLAIMGAMVDQCVDNIPLPPSSTNEDWHLLYAKSLLNNSSQPLRYSQRSTFPEFCAQFINQNMRWETLAIFLSAVVRATMDIQFFPSLYTTEEKKYSLRKLCTRLADYALEITISLDCLNDLQVCLQYENFIVHSHVDGDHSYYSWRKLGDVISSIYALGYHENLDEKPDTPRFLTELRKAVFARVYSADKNVAIFVGRPPRMNRQFCHFQIPSSPLPDDVWFISSDKPDNEFDDPFSWNPSTKASYMAETRWTALCAGVKEDILNLQRSRPSDMELFYQRVADIKAQAEKNYSSLPRQFQFRNNLRDSTLSTFERDFIGSVQLNHLHTLFLLNLLLLSAPTEPDPTLVDIADQILSVTVDMVLLRDQLTNSGTCLLWKVAYHCLPAAGILLLALLNERATPSMPRITRPRTLQHLTILAAEIQAGSIIRPQEPNYELMSKAMQTIQSFLDSVTSEPMRAVPAMTPRSPNLIEWSSFPYQQSLDFEIGFWESLADHPLLSFQSGIMAPE
ncbi:hypothetical protein CBS63078_892 [Aspergillus niger]|nr:hypothetical protein CBS11852_1704 [Aspergillus niger]KAI2936381.1 hypothetical protein CBS63078_892 [Aspergillus niger]KAI2962608.1 hypothetical protein CBS147323_7295 [Aspergillus niger]KAI3030920.1 hypothetical protein CBS147347_2240 [Aspergillus niger]